LTEFGVGAVYTLVSSIYYYYFFYAVIAGLCNVKDLNKFWSDADWTLDYLHVVRSEYLSAV